MSEPIRFFLPGPTWVCEEVRETMTRPPTAHRAPAFMDLYAEVEAMLPRVFRTARPVVLVSGSGTLGMEIAVISTVRRDILHLTNGAFSERWQAISQAHGKEADAVAVPWGEPVDPELVRQALRRKRYEAVAVTHNETSTGVLSPLEEIARVVREESDALILVDAISSLAGARLEADAWGLDVVVTGSQKALGVPPGLALLSVSERAEARAGDVDRRGFYTDLLRYLDHHRGGSTITTPAMAQIHALRAALADALAEGVEARWDRHWASRRVVETWVEGNGFTYASKPSGASPTVSCLRPPPGLGARDFVAQLAEKGFTVGSGYGQWKESTFRISHMGEVRERDLKPLLAAIDLLQG